MATAITIRKDPGHEVILSTTKHSHFADPSTMRVKKTYHDILETAEKHPEIRTADLMTKWCQATSPTICLKIKVTKWQMISPSGVPRCSCTTMKSVTPLALQADSSSLNS